MNQHYRIDDPNNPPPRDGTNIDLWRNGERFVGKWHRIEKQWIYRCRFNTLNYADDEFFNHWSPIVPPGEEPQESVIRWHGPEVAATWPDGSVVLVDHSEEPRRYCVDLAWSKIEVNAKHAAKWRYALIKRGGE